MKEDAKFYVGQKAFIKKGDEVLVLGLGGDKIHYPGGKIQIGEIDLKESIKREVREETGLEIKVGEPFYTWAHILPESHKLAGEQIYLVGYRCEYLSGDVILSDEHDKFRWVNKDNYKEIDDGSSYFDALGKYFQI